MKQSKRWIILFFTFIFSITLSGIAAAQDGQALYTSKGCVACHGTAGKEPIMPNYPKLAGQNSAYLLEQVKDIKSGARSSGQAAVMKPMVANVTDDELKAIADYLSKQ